MSQHSIQKIQMSRFAESRYPNIFDKGAENRDAERTVIHWFLIFNIFFPAKKLFNILGILLILTFQNSFSQNFWQQTSDLYLGDIRALIVKTSNSYLFAGTGGGGVFLSTDNGISWTGSGLANLNVQAFAVNGTNLFAGTIGGGVYLSTNSGTSWMAVNSGLTSLNVNALAVSGSNLFAGTGGGGVFLSTNNGTSWTGVNSGLTNLNVQALVVNSTILFAGTGGGGVFLSTDNGTSWTAVNSGLTDTYVQALAVNGTNLFAGTVSGGGGVFLSTNNGTSWTTVNSGLTNLNVKAIAINGTNLFAGTDGGGIFVGGPIIPPPAPSNLSVSPISDSQINLTWTASVSTDKYYLYRSLTSGTGYVKIDSVNSPATSYNNTGLTSGTAYYYIVKAVNLWGVSPSSIEASATTPLAPPQNLIATAGNGQVTLRWKKNAETGFLRYRIYMDTAPSPATKVDSTTAGATDTVKTISGLLATNRYYFRLKAIDNSFNESNFSNEVTAYPDISPPTFGTLTAPTTIDISLAVNVSIVVNESGSGISNVILYYRKSGDATFSQVTMTGASTYSGLVPTAIVTEKGVEYYVRATDVAGNASQTTIYSVQVNIPGGVTRNDPNSGVPVYQPSGNTLSAYSLFAIPLLLDNPSTANFIAENPALGSYDKKVWRWYDYDRTTQRFIEYPGFSSIYPDHGYMLIVDKPGVQLKTGSGITLPTNQPYLIALTQGWSIIGNPFNYDIPFDSISVTNGIRELQSFNNGTWGLNTTGLKSWEGCAVYVDQNTTLNIRPGRAGLNKEFNPFDIASSNSKNWFIQIKAKLNDTEDVFNFIGQQETASDQYDWWDLHKPPVFGGIRLEIIHPEWAQKFNEIFTTDIRQVNNQGHYFDFDVIMNSDEGLGRLIFEGFQYIPVEYLAFVVDKVAGTSTNLRYQNEIQFAPSILGKKQYRLLLGTKEFVSQNSVGVELFPTQYKLAQNYPNPFNPETNIQYSVPEPAYVRLEIFNLLGQKVRTLVDENQPMDNYSVVWNSRNDNGILMPSGIYFYRIIAGKFVQTRKMVLLK